MMPDDSAPPFQSITDPLHWWAARTPDAIALIEGTADDAQRWTYAALETASRAVQATLIAYDVRPGDRVAILGENSAAMVALMFGASLAGAWVLPLNPRLTDREIDEIRGHATPRCVLCADAASLRGAAQAEHLGAQTLSIAGLGVAAITATDTAVEPEPDRSIATLIYTSGTTGRPKGVMLTHGNLVFSARSSGLIRALGRHDLVYSVLPITHSLGFTGVLLGTLTYGGTLVLAHRFDPASALRAIDEDGITVMVGAPVMFALLAEYTARKGRPRLGPNRLRLIACAGAPLDLAVKHAVEACFRLTLNNGYGITECAPTITQTRIDQPRVDCSVGALLPGIEARLADASPGAPGALQIRGPNVMAGYFRDADATALVVDSDGWFDTGDLARFEGDAMFIVGRSKEQINRFGFKIYPAEVEAVLNAYPGVRQSAVVGQGEQANQSVVAFIEPAQGANIIPEALADYAATRLADYKRPSEIRLIAAMPMAATGKILKSALA